MLGRHTTPDFRARCALLAAIQKTTAEKSEKIAAEKRKTCFFGTMPYNGSVRGNVVVNKSPLLTKGYIKEYIMKNAKHVVISLTVDLEPDEATKPFGVKIIKADLPDGFEWAASSAMKRHSVLPLKAIKAAKPDTKPSEVQTTKAADVQALMAQPGIADLLATLMKAQGAATASEETPTLAQARKPGRPRKAG